MLWMPCRYNTFDGRLLWFDEAEGKRGLTLTVFLFFLFVCCFLLLLLLFGGGGGGGGGEVKLFHCIVRTGVYGILCV